MSQTNGVSNGHGPSDIEADVLIIGGGFGGMYAIHKVRELGLKVKLLEAGSAFGGTWFWNRYPGARVDSETPYYQLSIPQVYKTWNFSERFPDHVELRQYFNHVDKTLQLSKDTLFNTIVVGASYEGNQWVLNIEDGRTARCKYLILATGSSYKKHYPAFKGLANYKGTLVHSAIYPDGGLDVKGKKVGIVGNGATGVQILQELAKEDCQLTAFIRTPNIALPMRQRKMTVPEQEASKNFYDAVLQSAKQCRAGFPYNPMNKSIWEVSEDERLAHFEDLWARGGFAFLISNYRDFLLDQKANKLYYDFWAKKTRERIKNVEKADIVAPLQQEHFLGTKRPSLEQDYYECVDRDNVDLVNLKKTPLQEFTANGIVTADGKEREFDIVILATGYDAVTGSLTDMNLKDKNGNLLQDKWKTATYTHLGLTIDGMPNMFMVYSPQAPTSLSNGPPIIEIQVDWAVEAIRKMREEGIDAIDAKHEAAVKWRQDIQDMNAHTLYPLENSWYMGANIPGKPREQLIYLAGVDEYERVCRDALNGWKGFDVIKAAAS